MTAIALIPQNTRPRSVFGAATALLMLSGCMAGPDFVGPASVSSQRYDEKAERQLVRGGDQAGAQRIILGGAIEGNWWATFASPKLDAMMRRAIDGNLDLAAADATIAQAGEAIAVARGGLMPQADFGAQAGRERTGGRTANFYAVGPIASFDIDISGGKKRFVEETVAFADLEKHRYDAAYLTLTGEVASQALLLASTRAQITAVESLLAEDRKNLDIIGTGYRYGSATSVDVASAEAQLAQDQALLPQLAQQRDTAHHALSVLAGKGPADWIAPDFDLADFSLQSEVPVSLPSDLARNRPDILAAEAQLRAASAAIGVATADLYPHLRLSASLGTAGPGFGTIWSVVAGLTGPLFRGGAIRAGRRASIDAFDASLARYRQTVVRSLGQVADLLQAISHDGEERAAQNRSLDAAEAALRLSKAGYRAGATGALQVLDAERAHRRASLGQIRASTARYLDTVQLFVALGGNANGAFAQRMATRSPR